MSGPTAAAAPSSLSSFSIGGGLARLLVLAVIVAVAAAIWWLISNRNRNNSGKGKKGDSAKTNAANLVDPMMMMFGEHGGGDDNGPQQDPSETIEAHLARTLRPDSDHWDVIVAILCSPLMIQWSVFDQQRVQAAVEKRRQELDEEKSKKGPADVLVNDLEDLVNAGGWGDDDENDGENDDHDEKRRERAAKKADEERKELMENLKIATGKATVQVEGIDDGVIGQKWVESKLQAVQVWPPESLSYFAAKTYAYPLPLPNHNNKPSGPCGPCGPMDHPGIRRMLCIALGRLHSSVLNNHPELLAAGNLKKLDQTYFRAASEVRQRTIMLLNSALKVAAELGHPRLCRTVIETLTHFKMGAHPKVQTNLAGFNDVMVKTYGVAPKLSLTKQELREHNATDPTVLGPVIPPGTVLPCNSQVILCFEVERTHAEAFLRHKLAVCQQQGVPPQEALKTFREPWWFLVDGPKSMRDGLSSGGDDDKSSSLWPAPSIVSYKVPADHLALFEKDFDRVLIQITPMIIQNISQRLLAVRMGLKTPGQPGSYALRASLYSTEFLGADLTDITFQFQCAAIDQDESPSSSSSVDDEAKKDK
jgi:hypothetical protein